MILLLGQLQPYPAPADLNALVEGLDRIQDHRRPAWPISCTFSWLAIVTLWKGHLQILFKEVAQPAVPVHELDVNKDAAFAPLGIWRRDVHDCVWRRRTPHTMRKFGGDRISRAVDERFPPNCLHFTDVRQLFS